MNGNEIFAVMILATVLLFMVGKIANHLERIEKLLKYIADNTPGK